MPNKAVIVGVSGGPDSLGLLDGLWRLEYPLLVVHVNHGLRPEADSEAETVELFARKLEVPIVLEKQDAGAYAEAQRLSVEEAARAIRYGFLFKHASRISAQAVLVAHTADDQVETVLMHLLRGAGMSGLCGMDYLTLPTPWSNAIPLVRPLLGIWREEILLYLQENQIEPIFDRSNLDVRYYRNRLRHELLPYLETYNPAVRKLIWQTAGLLREDEWVLKKQAEQAWEQCLVNSGEGFVTLGYGTYQKLDLGLQRRVLRIGISILRPGLRDIDFKVIERAIHFLVSPSNSKQMELAAGLRLSLEADKIWIASLEADLPSGDWPQALEDKHVDLEVPGRVTLSGDWVLSSEWAPEPGLAYQQAVENEDPYQAWISADGLLYPLKVRVRQPGDKFQPHGMDGHSIKLSDYMINQKIPRRARAGWPLVCGRRAGDVDDTIIWVAGLRQSQLCSLGRETGAVIQLRLHQPAPDKGWLML